MAADELAAEEPGRPDLHDRVRRLEAAVLGLTLALLGVLGWMAFRPSSSHDVLRAERLEIVEPDGQPAFVLANSQRPARGRFDGEVLIEGREEERAVPSFIFFDGHGDEVGGMLFGNRETADGYSATRHLSMDGYQQDQTVQLFHRQSPRGAASGLAVNDRPLDRSLPETFRGLGLEVPFTPEELNAAIAAIPDTARPDSLRRLFGVNRVFLGSSDRDEATLVLKDTEGRPRIVLGVPDDGREPYLEVRDEEGRPVAELP